MLWNVLVKHRKLFMDFVHFSFSMSLEYGRKQVGQTASGSCGLMLPCDFTCGPLVMMFRTNVIQDI